jgi:RimJ/RimL family protein N-acetyltransferase
MLPNIIETARLRLRPIGLHDVEAMLSYATDPEWARYLPRSTAVPERTR